MTEATAAVVVAPGSVPELRSVHWGELGSTDVLIRVAATGVCHTDIAWADGELFTDFPVVLGHETAGVVVRMGSDVQGLEPGNRVVVALTHHCGHCAQCERGAPMLCVNKPALTTRLTLDGEPLVQGFGVAGMADELVVGAGSLVAIPDDVPASVAALMGCALATGYGAVVRLATVRPGETVAVLGCGAIGLSVVMAARAAGAAAIVAVDPVAERRDVARTVGATLTLSSDDDWQGAVAGGFDHVLEATGRTEVMMDAVTATRPGGTTTLIGAPSPDATFTMRALDFVAQQKRLLGCLTGNVRPTIDVPAYVALYRSGALPLDALVSAHRPLSEVAAAFADARAGRGVRTILEPDGGGWPS